VAEKPNERWASDLCRMWAGRDGWATLALMKSFGLKQEFIILDHPEQNGMVERLIRTLKEPSIHRLQHASRVLGDWIKFYNARRPHQALGRKTPIEA